MSRELGDDHKPSRDGTASANRWGPGGDDLSFRQQLVAEPAALPDAIDPVDPDQIVGTDGTDANNALSSLSMISDPVDFDPFSEPGNGTAVHLPSPSFADIEKAKLAIAVTQQRYREDQRRSRLRRDAFEAGAEAVDRPGRIIAATSDTIETYQRRGRSLFARYRREMANRLEMDDLDPLDFAIWLEGVRPFWDDATWRGNRQAADAFIRTVPHYNLEEALAVVQSIRGNQSPFVTAPSSETSVASRMEYAHFRKILNALRLQSRSEIVGWTEDWILAGIHVGLHPDEWRLTDIEHRPDHPQGEKFWLHVFNARVFSTSHVGSFRTIDLSNLSVDTRGAVERLVKLARGWTLDGTFVLRKSEVSKLLIETADTLFSMKLHYTLESLHHQFVANMKTIYRHEEVSALIGEMFVGDRASNYRNRRRAWDSDYIEVPVPLEMDVSRFRRSLAIFRERRSLRALREQYHRQKKDAILRKQNPAEPESW
jgi:hypothetical protein